MAKPVPTKAFQEAILMANRALLNALIQKLIDKTILSDGDAADIVSDAEEMLAADPPDIVSPEGRDLARQLIQAALPRSRPR